MANNNLTLTDITRESLRVLHQELNFVTNIVTEYDDSYSESGAKRGNSVRIRLPIQYATGTGATMATGTGADTLENQVTLTLSTQRHVPMRFTSAEMSQNIEEFSNRHVKPAMAKLAAMVESDALSMAAQASNLVSAGTAVDMVDILNGRKALSDALAPRTDRCALLDTQANVDIVNSNKGLFQASDELSRQYKEGMMGRHSGFDFFENSLMPAYTAGAAAGTSNYLTNSATAQEGSYTTPNSMDLIVDTGIAVIAAGDVFTIADVYDVHPETKASTGVLKQFTVLTGGTGGTTISVSPALIASGPYKNASAAAADNKALTFVGTASTAYKQSLLFQKGFAAFGTADLVLPPNEQASRANFDGISLRLVKDSYDPVKDRLYTRLDILYGFKVLRPQLGCRIIHT